VSSGYVLPKFAFRWDDPAIPPEANGSTHFLEPGYTIDGADIVVCLRSDRTPEQCHTTMLHELAHVFDAGLVDGGLPTAILEDRARLMSERLARLPWAD
jgi:hypothetical protein